VDSEQFREEIQGRHQEQAVELEYASDSRGTHAGAVFWDSNAPMFKEYPSRYIAIAVAQQIGV